MNVDPLSVTSISGRPKDRMIASDFSIVVVDVDDDVGYTLSEHQ